MAESPPSVPPSELAETEVTDMEEAIETRGSSFPPYPPYATEPAPPSVADTIYAGRGLRIQHKSSPKKPVHSPPKPARPKGPKATDVKLTRRAARANARCLRKHGAVLTDRLERMAKPLRRNIIYLWREHAQTFPPETITRLRSMLDADEPFKPDQAYEYFININKTKKKANANARVNEIKKDVVAMYGDKRFAWARNATIAFARGIQQRLSRPGRYALTDGMSRLSDIVLNEVCGSMHMKTPSRRCIYPKARFMMDVSDKVAVWIDEVISESDDRMLMMDFDEDVDVFKADEMGGAGFGGDGDMIVDDGLYRGPQQAYLKFTGEMLEAFTILTNAMHKEGDKQLIALGKFKQSYAEAADELKTTPDFHATEFNSQLACKLNDDLEAIVKSKTPKKIEPFMKDMLELCANYLAQHAEFNKDKGPAFHLLVKTMKAKGDAPLYKKGKAQNTFTKAAKILEESKSLETNHDDPNLSQQIHGKLSNVAKDVTTPELKTDMNETLDIASKYLSQNAVDEIERGPAFKILIKELEKHGSEDFTPEHLELNTKTAAAYTLKSAPGLSSITPEPETAPKFAAVLHRVVDAATPEALKTDMNGVVELCANYLSGFIRDRDKVYQILMAMMKSNSAIVAKRNDYAMNYGAAAAEIEAAPNLVPFLPVKDIADEAEANLARDVKNTTPSELKLPMKTLVHDVGQHLSQAIALRSGAAGDRYGINFLAAVKDSLGTKELYKLKTYGQTYSDAAEELKHAGPLDVELTTKSHITLHNTIDTEMKIGVPSQLAPTVAEQLNVTMTDASKHLAKQGVGKGKALDYLVDLMKEKGDAPLGEMQGYEQTYDDGARRIENSPTLTTDKVHKETYENIKEKLTTLTTDKPAPDHAKHLPGLVDDSSKFLSAPIPEDNDEKRRVLADLMARKGVQTLDKEGDYKMTYTEGGKEITNAPVGVTTAQDEEKKKDIESKINAVIPNKKMQDLLKDPLQEGAAHIADVINERSEMEKGEGKTKFGASETEEEARRRREEEERLKRINDEKHGLRTKSQEEALRKQEEEEARRKLEEEERLRRMNAEKSGAESEFDSERIQAQDILQKELKSHGNEVFYEQPRTELTHKTAADWIAAKPAVKVDKTVKESADTTRLHKKFEKKLSTLVIKATPPPMYDTMQDVVIESSRILSERFVSESYKTQVHEVLVSEMQKRGNEILIEVDGAAETHFFAAQRLKKDKNLVVEEPCIQVAHYLSKNLDDMIRCRSMARKLTGSMKEHIKVAADYLSNHVTKPDSNIEAYVSLLGEMEATGDTLLIDSDTPKSYKEAAAYLSQLTSFEDQIKRPNKELQSTIEAKLKQKMENVTPTGYSKSDMNNVIEESTKLLVSYIMLQGEKTEVLKLLIAQMDRVDDNVLLRHGNIRKSYGQAADMLRGKNTDQLKVQSADPVVMRKIQIKLNNLISRCGPHNVPQPLLQDVVEDATMYLAVQLLQPQIIHICKCMKNVFVQCELWCDEILRQVTHPCCTCSRHVSAQALSDLAPTQGLRINPGCSRAFSPGIEISFKQCHSKLNRSGCEDPEAQPKKTLGFNDEPTTSNMNTYNQHPVTMWMTQQAPSKSFSPLKTDSVQQQHKSGASSPDSFYTPFSSSLPDVNPFSRFPSTMYMRKNTQDINIPSRPESVATNKPVASGSHSRRSSQSEYTARTPIISMDQMLDWHAMLVSLMWNMQAWRDWIQENIDQALAFEHECDVSPAQDEERWATFQRRVATEAMQWRQYNIFSRQFTLRLALRYKDKKIVSPTRPTLNTKDYLECQEEMLEIINMFNQWTHWLILVLKETDSIRQAPGSNIPIHKLRWNHIKKKIQKYSEDWQNYNSHLKVSWEQKYKTLITDWLPAWKGSGPVWVVSACGAVPSGAVAAGMFEGEVIWVVRTTHKCNVLPAALYPSKHCCLVYADGAVHHYTKYQVMCNAEVSWVAWRAGKVGVRAVRVSPGVHVGRVLYRGSHLVGAVHAPTYRCHVVIFDRPFAFNCYELLVLLSDDESS